MRIGIDARELCGKPTGVGRHLAGLLGAWENNAGALRQHFFLYAHQTPPAALPPNATVRILPGAGGTLWEQTTLPHAARADHLDVFFAPGYTAPLRLRVPLVLLVHDVSFVAHPEWFRVREGLRRRLLTRWASRRAQIVLTVSETAREEIVSRFELAPHRVRRIYPGISRLRQPETTNGRREPLVLFVGSIFNRRHIPDLIEAFRLVSREHPEARMEIVGDNRTYPHQGVESVAAAEGLQDIVVLRSYAPDDVVADLYRRASAFAFLSEYEGFGHPPLEALAAGVPGVLLDTPVARETCLDAAIYVKCQAKQIAAALADLLYDEKTRARILEAAPGVVARYSWDNAAQQTLQALEDAA
ncbi:MAG TPA: glycosyltransferase family 1 protein [Vicinamibacterales bacterium]|jgi:glycosyltransferase involved in cell wall biosynthesis|nr:glycosyltransferase family 1 protein [Vicinamibacterales bacterium]